MIRVNLLPYRQIRREAQQRQFNVIALICTAAAVACVLIGTTLINHQIDSQLARNNRLDQEIASLDQQIADIKNLKTQIKLMIERKQVVENLQRNRHQSVVILDELSRQLPDGMYFKSIKQQGNKITLTGVADTNARVATMVRNLNSSHWLNKPALVEIKAVNVEKEKQNLFTLNVNIKPQDILFDTQIAQQAPVH